MKGIREEKESYKKEREGRGEKKGREIEAEKPTERHHGRETVQRERVS